MKHFLRFLIIRIYPFFLFSFLTTEIKADIVNPKGVFVDDTDEMFQLADLLEGVSVDCAELPSETNSSGINNVIVKCIWISCK